MTESYFMFRRIPEKKKPKKKKKPEKQKENFAVHVFFYKQHQARS